MPDYLTPGVYIEEIPSGNTPIQAVPTAIPVFIGYTQKAENQATGDLLNVAFKISALTEYEQHFGVADDEKGIRLKVSQRTSGTKITPSIKNRSPYLMHYALQAFFANGGESCYIVSVGSYAKGVIQSGSLLRGFQTASKVDEITLIVYPDAVNITDSTQYFELLKQSLSGCTKLKDRFTLYDVKMEHSTITDDVQEFRNGLSGLANEASFGAAYYPNLQMQFAYQYHDKEVWVSLNREKITLDQLQKNQASLYADLKHAILSMGVELPPSAAMAGVISKTDLHRGVWKAPANVSLQSVLAPLRTISDNDQQNLQMDAISGLSINPIRQFSQKGTVVWGARTLAGNDNEWRYISVRRFAIMVEKSIKKYTHWAVFEPNDANTWSTLNLSIDTFLIGLWKQGALQGAKPEEAFYVKVGLGTTMTASDIHEGQMIVEIGMAIVRPAEFITIQFAHQIATGG